MNEETKERMISELSELAGELVAVSRNLGSPKKAEGYIECVKRIIRRRDEIMYKECSSTAAVAQ